MYYTHSGMVWLLLLLETVFVCLLIYCKEIVQFMKFVPWCCLAIEYIQYKMVSFRLTCSGNLLFESCVEGKAKQREIAVYSRSSFQRPQH